MRERERIPKDIRDEVHAMFGGNCAYCGCELKKGWHVDHVVPVAVGGVDGIENLMPACPPCNNFKTSFTLEQFRIELQLQVHRGRKYSINFKMAERYNQIEVKETPIVFWFEKLGHKFDERLVPFLKE